MKELSYCEISELLYDTRPIAVLTSYKHWMGSSFFQGFVWMMIPHNIDDDDVKVDSGVEWSAAVNKI